MCITVRLPGLLYSVQHFIFYTEHIDNDLQNKLHKTRNISQECFLYNFKFKYVTTIFVCSALYWMTQAKQEIQEPGLCVLTSSYLIPCSRYILEDHQLSLYNVNVPGEQLIWQSIDVTDKLCWCKLTAVLMELMYQDPCSGDSGYSFIRVDPFPKSQNNRYRARKGSSCLLPIHWVGGWPNLI